MYSYLKIENKETKTSPTIIHANGKSKNPEKADVWIEIIKKYKKTNPQKKPLRNDLTIVTWKGGKYSNITTILEESCQKFGVNLQILPWPSHINDFWEASKAKVYETLNAIQGGKITTKYIMALDASDVIFLKHPNEILDDFISIYSQYKSIWCTEANDWPRFDLPKYVHNPILDDFLTKISHQDKENIKVHGSRFAFINAGCVIAETQSLVQFYETGLRICSNLRTNDQAMARISQFTDSINHGQDNLCKIFQCLYDVDLDSLTIGLTNE